MADDEQADRRGDARDDWATHRCQGPPRKAGVGGEAHDRDDQLRTRADDAPCRDDSELVPSLVHTGRDAEGERQAHRYGKDGEGPLHFGGADARRDTQALAKIDEDDQCDQPACHCERERSEREPRSAGQGPHLRRGLARRRARNVGHQAVGEAEVEHTEHGGQCAQEQPHAESLGAERSRREGNSDESDRDADHPLAAQEGTVGGRSPSRTDRGRLDAWTHHRDALPWWRRR